MNKMEQRIEALEKESESIKKSNEEIIENQNEMKEDMEVFKEELEATMIYVYEKKHRGHNVNRIFVLSLITVLCTFFAAIFLKMELVNATALLIAFLCPVCLGLVYSLAIDFFYTVKDILKWCRRRKEEKGGQR